jgi:cell division protein FtsQ
MRRVEVTLAALPARLRIPQALAGAARLQGSGWHVSKLLSGLLLACVIIAAVTIHREDEWFIYGEDVRFEKLVRLRGDELYAASGLEGWNVFWLQPQVVRQRLMVHEWIDDVRIHLTLPAKVTVEVQEVKPVAIWVTNEGSFWLAPDGSALPLTGDAEMALPEIVDSLQEARHFMPDERMAIDPQVLASALALTEALPELEGKVRYNRAIGLNFPLPKPALWVYWGDGFHMEEKLANLDATRALVSESETPPQIVDIRSVDRPYIR